MFSGLPRRRDNAKVIRLGAVSHITLAGDDPDFIVLEVFNGSFTTSKINLPRVAPIGKVFRFALLSSTAENASLGVFYVDIVLPLAKGVGVENTWRLYSGQRPEFIYGPNGWIPPAGSLLSLSGAINSSDLAFGDRSIASLDGVAVGYNAVANTRGAAIGWGAIANADGAAIGNGADGRDNGAACGRSANGSTNGVAIGRLANGSVNGTALGRSASANAMDAAVALGYNSKAIRYREMVKSADSAATQLQSWSMVNWYGTTLDAAATLLLLGGVAGQRCVLLDNSAFMFVIQGTAGVTGGSTTAGFHIIGVIKRGAGVATTALVGTPVTTNAGTNDAAITLAVSADATNGALAVTATGLAATTIKWNVTGTLSELRF